MGGALVKTKEISCRHAKTCPFTKNHSMKDMARLIADVTVMKHHIDWVKSLVNFRYFSCIYGKSATLLQESTLWYYHVVYTTKQL